MNVRPRRPPPPLPPVAVYTCPEECGWTRAYSTRAALSGKIMMHPAWGQVTAKSAAAADIDSHNCVSYILARQRIRRAMSRGTQAA